MNDIHDNDNHICDICNEVKKPEDFKDENGGLYCNECVIFYRDENKEYRTKKVQKESKQKYILELDYHDITLLRRILHQTRKKRSGISWPIEITALRILIKTVDAFNKQ